MPINLDKIGVFRIIPLQNLEYILRDGLYCKNAGKKNKGFVTIGSKEIITQRDTRIVKCYPDTVVNDYVPFYFHYKMPMLYKIWHNEVADYTGTQEEIIYLVSSAEKIAELQLPFVFTDRHAYVAYLNFFNQYTDLEKINWSVIKDETWYLQYSQIRKELKQAEFLVYQHLPVAGILGIVAHNEEIATFVRNEIAVADLSLKVVVKLEYYY